MKRIGKLLAAILLILAVMPGLSACRDTESEVPEGFVTATCYGADYRLYVPSTWVVNDTYGVSAAYRNSMEQSTVSLHRYETDEETEEILAGAEDRLSAYWEKILLPVIREEALGGEVNRVEEDCLAIVFGERNAVQRHLTAEMKGEILHILQVVAERNEAFYVFTYLANEKYYEVTRPEVDKMLEQFIFTDQPYEPEGYAWQLEKKDPDIPAGMKIAYFKSVPYRFYVPEEWVIDTGRKICSAWDPDDRANVSVLPYSPDESMGIKEYYEQEIESLKANPGIREVETLSGEETTVGGRKAMVYEFSCEIDGTPFRYRQYLVVYKSRIYGITYTATEETFGAHLDELETIVNAFAFR